MNRRSQKNQVWNVPNMMTGIRILLSIIMFCVIPYEKYLLALILFLFAAGTDWIDGWWARKFNQVTALGRIMDPFADKLIICGSFIYLITLPQLLRPDEYSGFYWGLAPWMAVVIVGRELLVTTLRAVIESNGGDFSAKWIGKWKMGLQCIAVPACFLYLICLNTQNIAIKDMDGLLPAIKILMNVSLWGTVLITLYSGFTYIFDAANALSNPSSRPKK